MIDIIKGLSVKAIFVAIVILYVGTMAASVIYSYSWIALSEFKLINSRQPAFIGWLLIGLFFTFLSGYVCAHLAKYQKVKNALALGIIMTIYAVILQIIHHQIPSDWMRIVAIIAYIPLAYAGGRLNQLLAKTNA